MDPIQDLLNDFAAQIADVTKEFGQKLARTAATTGTAVGPRTDVMLVQQARAMLARRRSRKVFFAADLFHEPAWDMLLALYIARHDDRTLFVKALVGSSDAPATTSQRWIDHLHRLGLVDRVVDPNDRRRIEISLSESGRAAMTGYLESLPDR